MSESTKYVTRTNESIVLVTTGILSLREHYWYERLFVPGAFHRRNIYKEIKARGASIFPYQPTDSKIINALEKRGYLTWIKGEFDTVGEIKVTGKVIGKIHTKLSEPHKNPIEETPTEPRKDFKVSQEDIRRSIEEDVKKHWASNFEKLHEDDSIIIHNIKQKSNLLLLKYLKLK